MARLAGRSTWFAWFAGVCCFAVIGALVVLATPLAPAVANWTVRTVAIVGDQFSGSEHTGSVVAAAPSLGEVAGTLPTTCDALSSPELLTALGAQSDVTVSSGTRQALAGVPGVAELLAAEPLIDCQWETALGAAHAWIAKTPGDARASMTEELLHAIGFACSADGDAVRCLRTHAAAGDAAASTETHLFDGAVWLVVRTDGSVPDEFSDAVAGAIWSPA